MSEQPEFFTYTRDEFLDEFVHPDDRAPSRRPGSSARSRSAPSTSRTCVSRRP